MSKMYLSTILVLWLYFSLNDKRMHANHIITIIWRWKHFDNIHIKRLFEEVFISTKETTSVESEKVVTEK
jgi:hypothetical protein